MISQVDIDDMGPPKIELEEVKENEDGSIECVLHMNAAGVKIMVEMGFNSLLLRGLPVSKTRQD